MALIPPSHHTLSVSFFFLPQIGGVQVSQRETRGPMRLGRFGFSNSRCRRSPQAWPTYGPTIIRWSRLNRYTKGELANWEVNKLCFCLNPPRLRPVRANQIGEAKPQPERGGKNPPGWQMGRSTCLSCSEPGGFSSCLIG